MAVAKMKYLNVYGPEKMLQRTLAALAMSAIFAPEAGEAIHSALRSTQNLYEPLLSKAKGLLTDLGESAIAADFIGDSSMYTLPQVSEYLETYAAKVAERSKRRTELENRLEVQTKTESLLAHMKDLDVDVEDLFSVKYLKVRVGRLPKNSYVRLNYYLEKGFNFTQYFNFIVYDFDGDYYWGVYFAPVDSVKGIDEIFNSLYFERIWVPEFVHGTPGEALQSLAEDEKNVRRELEEITTPTGIADRKELETIQNMAAWLAHMNQLYDMNKYALVFSHTFYIGGFVLEEDFGKLEDVIATLDSVHLKIAKSKEKIPVEPPVRLKNNAFSRPFQMFTEMYGLPGYHEVDPTFIVSIIYSLVYGLMFADLGQGIVLGLVGYFFMYRRMNMAIGLVLARAAIFCSIFGFLFGSVFGFENLMDPLWHILGLEEKPFEVMSPDNITIILIVSIAIGAAVVCLAIGMAIVEKFKRGMWGEAITSPNGIAGLVFYISVILLAIDMLAIGNGFSTYPGYIIFLIIVPLVVMYLQEPLSELINGEGWPREGFGGMLVSGFFELFVSILEFLSNTVSFLRVGGFILVHAGMMVVVMTLADLVGGGASIGIVIFGNAFVIVLEGLIVGIQALRLNYYEVFSRFYDPDGEPFTALRFKSDTTEL